jgi:hypothetical protein
MGHECRELALPGRPKHWARLYSRWAFYVVVGSFLAFLFSHWQRSPLDSLIVEIASATAFNKKGVNALATLTPIGKEMGATHG